MAFNLLEPDWSPTEIETSAQSPVIPGVFGLRSPKSHQFDLHRQLQDQKNKNKIIIYNPNYPNNTNTAVSMNMDSITGRLHKFEESIFDLAVFEKLNNECLTSVVNKMDELSERNLALRQTVDSSDAINETNSIWLSEIQNQIYEINNRLDNNNALTPLNNDHEDVMSSLNRATLFNDSLKKIDAINKVISKTANDISRIIESHNITIKTHFKFNEAYNEDLIKKIEMESQLINKHISTAVVPHFKPYNLEKQGTVFKNHNGASQNKILITGTDN